MVLNTRLLGGIGRAFSHRNFAVYTMGGTVSLVGTWLQKAAVGWLAWDLTRDPAMVGIVVSADLVPMVAISPFAGVIADRQRSLRLLAMLEGAALVQAILLAMLSFTGQINVELLILLTALLGLLTGLNQPIRQSLVNRLVPVADLPPAVAMNAVIFNTARIVGPSIAGFVIHYFGASYAFLLNAVSFVAMLAGLSMLRLDALGPAQHRAGNMAADIVAGYRYVLRHRGIGSLMMISMASALLLRPVLEMLPAFVGEVFKGNAEDLGFLMTATGLGALTSALWLAWRGQTRGLVGVVTASICLGSAAVLLFALSRALWVAAIAVGLIGMSIAMRGASSQALIQSAVDPAMRGRVLSVYTMVFNAGPALGALILGFTASWAGLQVPLFGAVGLNLLVWAWFALRRHSLVDMLEGGPASSSRPAGQGR
jgi:MFS family permease